MTQSPQIKPFSKNPRQISDKRNSQLDKDMQELGDVGLIVHDWNSGEVIDGNQRTRLLDLFSKPFDDLVKSKQLMLFKQFDKPDKQGTVALGFINHPTKGWFGYRGVKWDKKKRDKANIKGNLHAGDFDFDVLANQFDSKDLFDWGLDDDFLKSMKGDATGVKELIESGKPESVDAEPQIDKAQELLEKWKVKTGDLWQIGEHRLLCGSSIVREDVSVLFGSDKANLIWTDPPYGVKYGEKTESTNPIAHRVRTIENDDLPPEQLEEFIRSALKLACEFSVQGASIYVASPAGTPLPSLIASFNGSGFEYRWGLIWLKDQIVLSRADYHFKHENILFGWKPDGAHYFIDDRKQTSVFEYPRPKKSEEHPTMKPIELVQHMIRNSSRVGEIVYDAFGGSGTTMISSQNEGRVCRMMELSPAFCSVDLQRMSDAFPHLEIKRISQAPKPKKAKNGKE